MHRPTTERASPIHTHPKTKYPPYHIQHKTYTHPHPHPYSYIHEQVQPDELDMIDHVLLSPALASYVSSVYMYHGYPEGCDIMDSDHWPVVVDFDFGPATGVKEVAV